MRKIRMTLAATAVALASVLTVGLVAAPADAGVKTSRPIGCC
jgi:hypothetical protein